MKTHPESIYVSPEDIGIGIGAFSDERDYDDDVEFVPAAAYLELREFVERVSKSDSGDLACEAQGLIEGTVP